MFDDSDLSYDSKDLKKITNLIDSFEIYNYN